MTTPDPSPAELPGVRTPKVLRIERSRAGAPARLYIDGILFAYGTVDGFTVNPRRGEMPCVTFTMLSERVEVVDDAGFRAP
jgi:hypothetical protein